MNADAGRVIPTPADTSYLETTDLPLAPLANPEAFDLRTQGKLTEIRDHGSWGTCWTFATYASLESFLLPGATHDFAEEHMALDHGFDWGLDGGGNSSMAAAYLARWSGPVDEADDSYGDAVTPTGLQPRQRVQDILFPPPRDDEADNDGIKWVLQQHGAVYSSIHWTTTAYRSATGAFCYSGSNAPHHAVASVGWDDTYSRTSFASGPPGDGAFIVRNSWGIAGYFYVSYHDTRIGLDDAVFGAESISMYDTVHQHDPLGFNDNIGWGPASAWMASRFTAGGDEELAAVSFHALTPGTSYEVYLGSSLSERG